MQTDAEWSALVKGLLKAQLKLRDVSYQQLSELLAKDGIEESPENIANKISRGKFTAVFFVQCLRVIGCKSLPLERD